MNEHKVQINTCLVVEDHPHARKWLLEVVTQAFPDARVLSADQLSAARPFLHEAPDLALVDIGLPDGSGLDLVAPLVELGCEVVISTMFEEDEHLLQALKQGAKGYVLKDHPQQDLVHMLQGILNGQPPLSPSIARRVLNHFATHAPTPEQDDASLSEREQEVLTLLAKGYSVKAAAELLQISPHTVAGYAKTVYRKLNVSTRAEATMAANRLGFVR